MRRTSLRVLGAGVLALAASLAGCVQQAAHANGVGGDTPTAEQATGRWAVRTRPGASPDRLAARLGGVNQGPVAALPDTYLIAIADGAARAAEIDAQLRASPEVVWFEQQTARRYFPRGE